MSSIEILELIHFLGDSRIVWNREYEWKCQMCTKIIFVAMPLWGRDKTTQSSFHLKVPLNEVYNNFCLTVVQKLLFACVHFAGCRIIMVEWASQGRFVTKQSFKGQNILTTIIIVFCKKKLQYICLRRSAFSNKTNYFPWGLHTLKEEEKPILSAHALTQ